MGRAWTLLLSPVAGPARAMNLLSAVCTALAGALMAALVARETRRSAGATWGALAGALCAGLMASVWSNATETEVYAVSLLHVVVLLTCAARAGRSEGASARQWLTCTAYLIALAPALHLSALVGAPAAIALAARRDTGEWRRRRVLALGGTLLFTAGVGRVSLSLVIAGSALMLASTTRVSSILRNHDETDRISWRPVVVLLASCALASSALLVMLVRADVRMVSMAKNEAVAACDLAVDTAVQLHGGMGYLRETEVERHYRDSRILGIGGGTTEIMKEVIAKQIGL
jgi:hypothetical protein